jgi:hypothetical protein
LSVDCTVAISQGVDLRATNRQARGQKIKVL